MSSHPPAERSNIRSLICRLLFAFLLLPAAAMEANAASPYTWNTTDGNCSSLASWLLNNGPTSPGVATDVYFFGGSGSYTATEDIAGALSLRQLNFTNSSGTVSIAPSGSSFSFGVGSAATPNINMTGAGDVN